MLNQNQTDQNASTVEKTSPGKDISDAGKLVNILLLAWKNYSLYPEGHIAVSKALNNLKTAFDTFFSGHSTLRLDVEKNKLLCDNTPLHEVAPESSSEDMVTLLYRDGIQWLEFHRGLPLEELVFFFSIIHKYRMMAEETEGDIVTDLTDGDPEYIQFKAVDIFWDGLPLIDFESLNAALPTSEESSHNIEDDSAGRFRASRRNELLAKSIADPAFNQTLWEISTNEQKKLQQMVQEEENWDNAADVLDVLLIILHSQTDRYNFSSVLDFTLEEVVDALKQGEFGQLLNLFHSLQQMINDEASPYQKWRRPLIERFFQDLSQPDIFDIISGKLIMLKAEDTEKISLLREMLLYFNPSIILSLGPVILRTRVPEVQIMIMEVIEYLCLKDINLLESLLDHPERRLAVTLLPMLKRLKGERSSRIFFKMTEHPSELVRGEAVKILLKRDPQSVLKLFSLLDDPSIKIRSTILASIALQKSSVLENLLLKHIKENIDHEDSDYILGCYETLGRCGSSQSIPFLQKVLLTRGWNQFIGLGKPVHREGAAIALTLLDNRQAKNILITGAKSRFQVIREAIHRASTRTEESGEVTSG